MSNSSIDDIAKGLNGSGVPNTAIKAEDTCNALNGYMLNGTCFTCTAGNFVDLDAKVCRPCNGVICEGFCGNGEATCNWDDGRYVDTSCTSCGILEAFGWTCQYLKPYGQRGCRFNARNSGWLVLQIVIMAVILFGIAYIINRATNDCTTTSVMGF